MKTVDVKEGRVYLAPRGSYDESASTITSDYIFIMKCDGGVTEDVQRNPIEKQVPNADPAKDPWRTFLIELGRAKKHFEATGFIKDSNQLSISKHNMRKNLETLSSVNPDAPMKSELDFVYKNLGVERKFVVTVNKFSVDEKAGVDQANDPRWDINLSLIVGTFKG